MRVAMVGGRVGRFLRTIVIMRRFVGSGFGGIVTVMADMEMLPGFILWKVINRVTDRRYAGISDVERKDQR
jgi:hypothetical protein